MSNKRNYLLIILGGIIFSTNFISCSKGGDDGPSDPCAGKTITVTATVTPSTGCGAASGTVTANATGSNGFTYKISTGASFQSSGVFGGLPAGTYVITAKDAAGCTKTQSVTVGSTGGSFTVTAATSSTSGCASADGSITVTATGSTGYQYKINAGAYGASNVFSNLTEGAHTIFVKDGAGCENSQVVTVTAATAPGTKFTAVRNLINAKCTSCHSGAAPAGGRDWTVNCNVVNNKTLINNRAVVIGDMPQGGPQLTTAEKAIITDWINAGGLLTN
jgi:hypothetical protein